MLFRQQTNRIITQHPSDLQWTILFCCISTKLPKYISNIKGPWQQADGSPTLKSKKKHSYSSEDLLSYIFALCKCRSVLEEAY